MSIFAAAGMGMRILSLLLWAFQAFVTPGPMRRRIVNLIEKVLLGCERERERERESVCVYARESIHVDVDGCGCGSACE